MSTPRSTWAIWRWPVALAAATAIGLVAGLFSDKGAGDTVAAIGLAIPIAAAVWFGWLKR